MATVSVDGNVLRVEREDGVFNVPINDMHRYRFEMLHGTGSILKLYSLLAEDCKTFTDIGKLFGLTRERIRQIHKKRIAPFLPHKDGLKRMRRCTLTRVHIDQFPEVTLDLWREARRHSVAVHHLNSIRANGDVSTLQKVLMLNGKSCKIQKCRRAFYPNEADATTYARMNVYRRVTSHYDFSILVAAVPGFSKRYFIVPVKDLLASHHATKDYFMIYLPIERRPVYNNIKPIIDWSQYENAWHLLKES